MSIARFFNPQFLPRIIQDPELVLKAAIGKFRNKNALLRLRRGDRRTVTITILDSKDKTFRQERRPQRTKRKSVTIGDPGLTSEEKQAVVRALWKRGSPDDPALRFASGFALFDVLSDINKISKTSNENARIISKVARKFDVTPDLLGKNLVLNPEDLERHKQASVLTIIDSDEPVRFFDGNKAFTISKKEAIAMTDDKDKIFIPDFRTMISNKINDKFDKDMVEFSNQIEDFSDKKISGDDFAKILRDQWEDTKVRIKEGEAIEEEFGKFRDIGPSPGFIQRPRKIKEEEIELKERKISQFERDFPIRDIKRIKKIEDLPHDPEVSLVDPQFDEPFLSEPDITQITGPFFTIEDIDPPDIDI